MIVRALTVWVASQTSKPTSASVARKRQERGTLLIPLAKYVGSVTSPSFNLVMDVQFGVKNTNFGHFKYGDGIVEFDYRGTKIGQTNVYEAHARALSTKKVDTSLYLSSNELKGNS
ncbi:hypothetical protein C1H46_032832 [Malus baccata]|uniref:Late embryogenesis abundant protein LEA-2 subgroup domain-containing protein n=1 Tax=Malus baccata TaxID=106549 RepID=A0A540L535_MALBA|nr:hypothetical protein C1H46_032832 [Malus baccata]